MATYKVHDPDGHYMAATKEIEAAAAIVGAIYGPGSTIRYRHRSGHVGIVWTDGIDGDAGESYDTVAQVAAQRIKNRI